ncbi:subtilisin-like protease sbt1.7 [Nicotiana attenuata]|uniref:Subtilisin-like protease sbt1.7 n=1 Tax=Nicotiana attenuata TaxID=49451 RepID=A0A1J6KJK0_NICAT|nr:subtilisin-like protease sbt1.7 [Nicotiana attenuata]
MPISKATQRFTLSILRLFMANLNDSSSSRIVYSYRNVLNGFAARLTRDEAELLQGTEGIISECLLHPLSGRASVSSTLRPATTSSLERDISRSLEMEHHWMRTGMAHMFQARLLETVYGANVFYLANGTASGVAPVAHVAMYKVCDASAACSESDTFAAMDAAIEDGPEHGTVANGAPWLLTVGASTTDRKLRATVLLGNGEEIDGESAFQPEDFSQNLLPLVYSGTNTSDSMAPFCSAPSLKNIDVKGKIVLCEAGDGIERLDIGHFVKDAGAAGMILMNEEPQGFTIVTDPHVLPAAHISFIDGLKIKAYINSTSTPVPSFLFQGTVFGDDHAPAVAAFSSRGPFPESPGILKPDIIGPGISILAAWPTSELTLIKSAHPEWSSAAIKSAIMTTADLMNLGNNPIEDERGLRADFFATGAGHVNPLRANDPGLIYDIQPNDYIPYLCGLYPSRAVSLIVLQEVNCSSTIPEAELNYPSFSIKLGFDFQVYTRTVTNVGEPVSSYTLEIVPPQGVDVKVEPSTLHFSEIYQKITYQVTFNRSISSINATFVEGFLKWSSSKHFVRSPIVVTLEP